MSHNEITIQPSGARADSKPKEHALTVLPPPPSSSSSTNILALPALAERPLARRANPTSADVLRPFYETTVLQPALAELWEVGPRLPLEAWLLAAARLRALKAKLDPFTAPAQGWLEALAQELAAAGTVSWHANHLALAEQHLTLCLPNGAAGHAGLLGEVLLTWRAYAESLGRTREGRAGRLVRPEVYTPQDLATEVLAPMPTGHGRLLDPACGAGSFLIAALKAGVERRRAGGQDAASAAREVLLREIAGVDCDPVAVALCRFNLHLEAHRLGGLTELPPLNLHCRDALGPLPEFDGGCALIAGNPPYLEGRGLSKARLAWLRACYRSAAVGKVNLFAVFVERALHLLEPGGRLALLVPTTFQRNERYRALRELLLEHTLESIETVHPAAFGKIVETVILRVRKHAPGQGASVRTESGAVPQRELALGPGLRFCTRLSSAMRFAASRMEQVGVPLGDLCEIKDGISTGFQPFPKRLLGHVLDERNLPQALDARMDPGDAEPDLLGITPLRRKYFVALNGEQRRFDPAIHVPIIDGSEFHQFTPIRWQGRWIEYDKAHEHAPPHPGKPFNCQLRTRSHYDRPAKLLSRQTASGLITTVDRQHFFVRNSVHVLFPKDGLEATLSLEALCACLNAALYQEYMQAVTGESDRVFPQVHISDLKRLPVLPELLVPGGPLCVLGNRLLALHGASLENAAAAIAKRRAEIETLLAEHFRLPLPK
jgi:methylase of polypeptide subunit release factors